MSTKDAPGPDVDLDDEVVLDERGQSTTEARAQQIAAATLHAAARSRGVSTSVLVREALERYLAS